MKNLNKQYAGASGPRTEQYNRIPGQGA